MGSLKCILIGCGAIAREHLTALADLKTVQVAAVCDISPARAEALAERFGIAKWCSNYEDLLTQFRPDLVHITSPPSSHFSIAKTCLSAGLNVLCEKPITVDYSEFAELKQLATENRCVLMEVQQNRFHSSIQRLHRLVTSEELGELLELHICISLNIFGADSAYIDQNTPHFSLTLRGGVIGDFLTHIAYLTLMFIGPVSEVRTIWMKHTSDSPQPADEFRALIKANRATAYVSFSGNARPDAFLVRIIGTKMRAEADLYEPPRLTVRRSRTGEPAVGTVLDGITESRDVLRGTLAGFRRKLSGTSSYDGMREFIAVTYRALELREPQPVPLDEIDAAARLVDQFTRSDFKL